MQINAMAFWTAIGVLSTVLIVIFGWVITVERRLAARMTFDQHIAVCDKSNETIRESFNRVLEALDEQRSDIKSIDAKVGQLTTDVAVLTTRMDNAQ